MLRTHGTFRAFFSTHCTQYLLFFLGLKEPVQKSVYTPVSVEASLARDSTSVCLRASYLNSMLRVCYFKNVSSKLFAQLHLTVSINFQNFSFEDACYNVAVEGKTTFFADRVCWQLHSQFLTAVFTILNSCIHNSGQLYS